jgi:hypothetical protein
MLPRFVPIAVRVRNLSPVLLIPASMFCRSRVSRDSLTPVQLVRTVCRVVCKRWNHHLTPTCKVMSTVFRNGSFSGVRRWQETLHFEGVAVVDTSVTTVEEKLSCRIYSFDCF